jgi:hypothetical protein
MRSCVYQLAHAGWCFFKDQCALFLMTICQALAGTWCESRVIVTKSNTSLEATLFTCGCECACACQITKHQFRCTFVHFCLCLCVCVARKSSTILKAHLFVFVCACVCVCVCVARNQAPTSKHICQFLCVHVCACSCVCVLVCVGGFWALPNPHWISKHPSP